MKRFIEKFAHIDGTAIGFSEQERVLRAELSELAGIGTTMVGLLLTGISFIYYSQGSTWFGTDLTDLERRKKVVEMSKEIQESWGCGED